MSTEAEPGRLADPPRTLVVVPALNESGSVAAVVASVMRAAPWADVLVVDDHSTDDTAAQARAAGALVMRLPFTLGVGGAMRTGYTYADRHAYQAVVQVDGDGQHDARHIAELVGRLDHADVVIGARFAGDEKYEVSLPRRLAMNALARLMSALTRRKLTDVTSGYRALGPRAIHLFAEHYPAEYLGDTLEALVIAKRCGLTITQVPVHMTAREHGRASQGVVGSVVYLCRALVAIGLGLVRRWTNPVLREVPR